MVVNNASPGIARAGIQVDTSSLERSKQVVVQSAQQMSAAFNQMGRQSQQSIVQVDGSLKNLSNTAAQTNNVFTTLFTGAFVTGGLAAAQNLRRVDTMFKIISGSQEVVNQRMEQLRGLAERTGIPLSKLKEDATGFLGTIGRTNVDLAKMLSIAQRLAILDPVQGIAGSKVALQEFISGDVTSLFRRFEIPRQILKQIKDESNGSAQAMIEGLDRYIGSIGLTENSLKEMGDAGLMVFDNAKAALKEAMAVGFTPLLQVLTPILQHFTALLVELNKGGGGFLQIAAAAGTAFIAMNKLLPLVEKLTGKDMGKIGTIAKGVIGVGAAAVGGVEVGVAGARGIGQLATSLGVKNERTEALASASQGEARAMLLDDLKKGLFVFIDLIRQAAEGIVPLIGIYQVGAQLLENAWNVVVASIQVGGSLIKEAFANAVQRIGEVLLIITNLGQRVGLNMDSVGQAGADLAVAGDMGQREAQHERNMAMDTIRQGVGLTDEQKQNIRDSNAALHELVDGGFRDFQSAIYDLLFPAKEAADAVEETSDALSGLSEKSGVLKDAVGQAREVIENFRSEMKKVADERGRQSGRDEEDFLRKRQRDNVEFGRQLTETETQRNQDRIDKIKGFQQQEGEAIDESVANRLKAEQEFAQAEIERAQKHETNLEKIKLDGAQAVEDAAASLDARAVANAMRQTNRQLEAANTTYAEETRQKNEQFAAQLAEDATQFTAMQAQKAAQFVQQMAADETNAAIQQAKQLEEFQRRQALEDEDRALKLTRQQEDWDREDELRRQKADEQLVKLAGEIDAEKALQDQWLTNMREFLDGSRQSFDQYLKGIDASTKQFMIDQQKAAEETLTSDSTGKSAQSGSSRRNVPGFALGGITPAHRDFRVGENGPEILRLPMQGFVFPSGVAPTSSSGAVTLNTTLNNNFGDIGSHSMEQITMTMRRVFNDEMTDLLMKAGQQL